MAQKDKKRNYRSNGNREYKSDVISMMLQIPEYALDVYNAMNDSAYTDPDMIQIMRLENGISLSVRNDASFFISNYLNLYEHQSTYSPNEPAQETDRKAGSVWQKTCADRNTAFCSVL